MFPCLLSFCHHLIDGVFGDDVDVSSIYFFKAITFSDLNYVFKLVQYGSVIYASITELVQRPTSATKILTYLLKLNMITCHILFLPPCYNADALV